MIIEQHYDEEVLIALLDEEKPDPHLQACAACTSALESIRTVATALHDGTVWDERELSEEPRRETSNALRSHAATLAAEDAAAEPWVKRLLARPAAEWQGIVEAHPEWRTAGFVRRLTHRSVRVNYNDPALSLELSKLATEVADKGQKKDRRTSSEAWREYAYALYYRGRYPEALNALGLARSFLDGAVVSEYEVARVDLLTAYVFGATQEFSRALDLCKSAFDVFTQFSDSQRALTARMFESTLLIRSNRFSEALSLGLSVFADQSVDATTRACAAEHAAICYRELGRFEKSRELLGEAMTLFEGRGDATRLAVVKRHLARTLLAEGRYEQALALSLAMRDEFRETGMVHDVALASLDAAESMILLKRFESVVDLCSVAIQYFASVSLTHTQGALTALAFMREAAQNKTLTPSLLHDVRRFFEILPEKPEILFVEPS